MVKERSYKLLRNVDENTYSFVASSAKLFGYIFGRISKSFIRCFQIGRQHIRLLCYLLCLMPFLIIFICCFADDPIDRNLELLDWPVNRSRITAEYVRPTQITNILRPSLCQRKVFLIIVVFSRVTNFYQRQTIRETWGNTTKFGYDKFSKLHAHLHGKYLEADAQRLKRYNDYISESSNSVGYYPVRVVFLMGQNKNVTAQALIRREAEKWNDIIQEDFNDNYNNLTVKAMLALKYMNANCRDKAEYVMKCDDDTFVNVPNLVHVLLGGTVPVYEDTIEFHNEETYQALNERNRLNNTSKLLLGYAYCNALPVTDVKSKWYMPIYMYSNLTYPRFLAGSGYVISMDVLEKLYNAALNTSLVYLEDLFLTGICAEKANLTRQNHPLFYPLMSKAMCAFKGMINQHQVKKHKMREAWKFVSNYNEHCPAPSARRIFKFRYLSQHVNC